MSVVGAIDVTVLLLSLLLVIVMLLLKFDTKERNTIKRTFKNIKFTFFPKHTLLYNDHHHRCLLNVKYIPNIYLNIIL